MFVLMRNCSNHADMPVHYITGIGFFTGKLYATNAALQSPLTCSYTTVAEWLIFIPTAAVVPVQGSVPTPASIPRSSGTEQCCSAIPSVMHSARPRHHPSRSAYSRLPRAALVLTYEVFPCMARDVNLKYMER